MPTEFYPQVISAGHLPPQARHAALINLHADVVDQYHTRLQAIPEATAYARTADLGDSRSFAQIVGHIAEWERFALMGASDILIGLQIPRAIKDMGGFVTLSGEQQDFASIDAFNAYHAAQHAKQPWPVISKLALETSGALLAMFAHPNLLDAERLEATAQPWYKRLHDPNRTRIENITAGWTLWLIYLEHLAVDHHTALFEEIET